MLHKFTSRRHPIADKTAAASGARATAANRAVAKSMGCPPAALPGLAETVADLATLGCHPPSVNRILERAGIFMGNPSPRIVDLGCGRGELSGFLAQIYCAQVLGVELHREFLAAARGLERQRRAEHPESSGRCEFFLGDVTTKPCTRLSGRARHPMLRCDFDLAVALNLTSHDHAAALARRFVPFGGHYLLDDAIAPAGSARAARTGAPTVRQVSSFVASLGDELVTVLSMKRTTDVQMPKRLAAIEQAVETSAKLAPAIRRGLRQMLENHRRAAEIIGPILHPTLLLVRKGPPRRV